MDYLRIARQPQELYIEAMLKPAMKKCLCLSLFIWWFVLPAWAASHEEAVTILEAGSSYEIEVLLSQHTVEQLYKVRVKGAGLLHLSLARDDKAWEKLIQAGWPVAKESGWTPQHQAALTGNAEALQGILAAGAKANVSEPINGGTPAHIASFNGHLDVLKVLVAAGIKINARDNDGWTALSHARDQGFPKIVDWLKVHGAKR